MTRARRGIIVAAMILGGSTAAWANFTASPDPVNVTCASGSGSATVTITNSGGSGSNALTISSMGACPGYSVTPNPYTFSGPGSASFVVTVTNPMLPSCTFAMTGTVPPLPIPAPTFTVTTSCVGVEGELNASPPSITFPPVQVGGVSTQSIFVTNNTGVALDEVRLQLPPGPFELDCGVGSLDCTRNFMPALANGQQVTPSPTVSCRGATPGSFNGMVTVTANGGMFATTIALACQVNPAGTGPQISVPATATAPPVAVAGAATSAAMFSISNISSLTTGAPLTVSAITKSGAAAADWTITGCSPSCTIQPMMSQMITATIDPSAIGDRSITLTIVNNDSDPIDQMKAVTLVGTGLGGLVAATPASGALLDFGQQPVMVTSAPLEISLVNTGNADVVATPILASPDFTVSPPDPTTIPSGQARVFQVRCEPQAAAPTSAMLVLDVPQNLSVPTAFGYALACDGFAATLVVTPSSLTFAPVRINAPPTMMTLMINNPTGAAVSVGPLTVNNPTFSLAGFATTATELLGGGATEVVTVTFDPATEATYVGDIAAIEPGRLLRVTGAGTVARYQAVPGEHDFGRVCVGDAVTQDFSLAVMPTSNVRVQGVGLGGHAGYGMSFIEPVGYPVTLAPSTNASVNVTVVAEVGRMDGMLTWSTDVVELAERIVPIQLEGIDDGLSVTPVAVDFGPVGVGDRSSELRPTLRSCGTDTFEVTATLVDNRAAAFLLSGPALATITEAATMPWGVSFAPSDAGRQTAILRLSVAGGDRVDIALGGGGRVDVGGAPGSTTYYACGCSSGSGSAVPGLVVIAILFGPRRRRRSATCRRS